MDFNTIAQKIGSYLKENVHAPSLVAGIVISYVLFGRNRTSTQNIQQQNIYNYGSYNQVGL